MNYETTNELLDAIRSYIKNSNIQIKTFNKDWRGEEYRTDYILIDEENNVGFEVFENEVIVYFFSEHLHIEDYTWTVEDGVPEYIARAKVLLIDLLTCTIRYEKTYKGKTLMEEHYILVYEDGTEECPAGRCVHSLLVRLVPFLSKSVETQEWRFDIAKGGFVELSEMCMSGT